MRRLLLLLITLSFAVMSVAPAQAAVASLKLVKEVTAQETSIPDPADPTKVIRYVDVNVAVNRDPLDTEISQYLVVLTNDSGKALASKPTLVATDPTKPKEFSFHIKALTDARFTISLYKRVGKDKKLVNSVKVTAKAPTPTPNPDTTITPGAGCYKFTKTVFGENICAQDFLTRAYLWAVGIAIIGAAGMIIFAGYKYAVSRGNPAELNNAKEIIISTLVGLALLVLSYTILNFLGVNVETPEQTTSTSGPP